MNPPLPTFTHLGNTVILRPGNQFSKQELNSRLHQMEVQYDQSSMSKAYFTNLYENALKYDQNKIKIFDRLIKDTIIYQKILKNNAQNFAHSPEKIVKNEKIPIIQSKITNNQNSFNDSRISNQTNISHNYNNNNYNNYNNDIQTNNINNSNHGYKFESRNEYNHETPNNSYITNKNNINFQKGNNQNETQYSFKNTIVNEIKKNQVAINNQNNNYNNNTRNEVDNRNQQYQNNFGEQSNMDEYQTATFGGSKMNNSNNTNYQSNYNNNSDIQTNYNSINPNAQNYNNNNQYKEQYNNSPFYEQKNYPNNQNKSNYYENDENTKFPQKYNNQNQQSYNTNNNNIQQNNLNYSKYERKNCIVDGNNQQNNEYNNNINNRYQNPHGNNINPISLTIQNAVNENNMNDNNNQYENFKSGYNPNNMQRNLNQNRRAILANNRGTQDDEDGDGESNFTFMSKFDRIKNFFNEKENRDTCFNILQFIIIAVILAMVIRYGIRCSHTIGEKVAETAKTITNPKLFIELIFEFIKAIIVELFWNKILITVPLILLSLYVYQYRKNSQFEKICKDIIEDIKKYLRTAPLDRNGYRTITINEIINRYSQKYKIDRKTFVKKYLEKLKTLRKADHSLKESIVINEKGAPENGWELIGMN